MNKTKSPKKLPSIQDVLGVGEKQRLSYKKPEHRKGIVSLCKKSSHLSPIAVEMNVERITLRPFTAVPACIDVNKEVVLIPQHGYAEVFIWIKGKPKSFKLNMGCGPVTIPRNHFYAIRTFASITRIHKVISGHNPPVTEWEEQTDELCKNKHILKPKGKV